VKVLNNSNDKQLKGHFRKRLSLVPLSFPNIFSTEFLSAYTQHNRHSFCIFTGVTVHFSLSFSCYSWLAGRWI